MAVTADFVIVGAGIIGAALAHKLVSSNANARVVVIERMPEPAAHQTGRNSGVIHAGVYYPPNSLKAQYCKEGNERTIAFCKQMDIAYEQCGKLLVATDDNELERIYALYTRCSDNGLSPQMLTEQQVRALEPNIRSKGGFKVSQSGITDYKAVCKALLQLAKQTQRCEVILNSQVTDINENGERVTIHCKDSECGELTVIQSEKLINCAGIYADELVVKSGLECRVRMLPFRGEYFRLSEKFNGVTEHLIYPIPDPDMPFLGVHLTKMIGAYTTVGPNAVLASGREAYTGVTWSLQEWRRIFAYSGTWKLLAQYPKYVVSEMHTSLSRSAYVKKIQKYCPAVTKQDLLPFRAGIRAQAVDSKGHLIHDFLFAESNRTLHVINAPSPAATSAMPIADALYDKIQ